MHDAQGMEMSAHDAVEDEVYALTARTELLHRLMQIAPKLMRNSDGLRLSAEVMPVQCGRTR
jgi:hypothetical protein